MKTHKFFIKDGPDRIDSHNSYSLISLPTRSDAHSLPRSRLPPIMNLKIEWTPVGTTLKDSPDEISVEISFPTTENFLVSYFQRTLMVPII